ncbi:type I secretion system permease/ATPase [Rhizobium sp. SAFR-030]|uniref:type I secretion system permease/ATPase n=1 Tax=Rhizobium sp. SAFR-030 TaxID=3387277 RepID=UPI003F817DCF
MQTRNEVADALRQLAPQFLVAGLFSGFINLLYLSSPLYLMQIYNRVLESENVTTLLLLTLVLALALLTMGALDATRSQLLIRSGIRFDTQMASRVFRALVAKSAYQGFSRGSQQMRQLDQFRSFVTGPGIYFAFDLPWIPLYLLLLFFIHPLLGGIATLGAIGLFGLALLNEKLTRPTLKMAEEAANGSYGFTENILRHADVVQAMGMQPSIERHWLDNRDRMLTAQAFASDRNATISSAIRFARLMLQACMLGTGAWLVINGAIQPATIFASSIIMGRALVPVEQGVAAWKQFSEARLGYGEVNKLLFDMPESNVHTIVPKAGNALSAREIVYRFPNAREPVLKGVSFDIPAGCAVGIVGPSGSGKSTLARLLAGATRPDAGTLTYGGIEYTKWDHTRFGQQAGYLPQDVGLFAGTVRENIARFGTPEIEKIVGAAKVAGIHDMIMALPQQYDTELGPEGVGLSGGQRQRLGLARALIGAPSLLVLDEPNANLDTAGEMGLRAAIEALKKHGSTVIVVTHRQAVLDVMDRLMFMRAGRVERYGAPDEVYAHIKETMVEPAAPVTAA